MAPPKIPVRARVDRRSQRDGAHLIWNGRLRKGRPHLKGVGNPARVLLSVDDPGIQIRNICGLERCIEPHHYRVIVETPFKYDDGPRPFWRDPRVAMSDGFNDRELEEIEFEVQGLIKGETTEKDVIGGGFKPAVLAEILLRASTAT